MEEVAAPVGIVSKGSKDGRQAPGAAVADAHEDPADHIYKVMYSVQQTLPFGTAYSRLFVGVLLSIGVF